MSKLVLLGGPGTGKSTICAHLANSYGYKSVSSSQTVIQTPLILFGDPRKDYRKWPSSTKNLLKAIHGAEVNLSQFPSTYSRLDGHQISQWLMDTYGTTVFAEAVEQELTVSKGVVDNIPCASNATYLKENGFVLVYVGCDFTAQVNRRLREGRAMDPSSIDAMRQVVSVTNNFFEINALESLADVQLDTTTIPLEQYTSLIERKLLPYL